MEEKKQTGGKVFIMFSILIIIALVGTIITTIATSKDSNPLEDKTTKEIENKNKEKNIEKKKIRSVDTFLNVIADLKYMNPKDYYLNSLVTIQKEDEKEEYYNVNTGERLFAGSDGYYGWFGNFGIFYDDTDDSYLIDDTGKTLFITDDDLEYYPETKLWVLGKNVYNKDGIVEKNAYIIDEEGRYILTEKDHELILEDSKLKPIYTHNLDKNEKVDIGELYSIYDEQYACISTTDNSFIINVKNGKEVYKTEKEINYKGDNIFEIGDYTYFVKDDKLAVKESGKFDNIETSYKYFALGNNVYDANTLNRVDSNIYIPSYEDAIVEKLTGLEVTECRTGYGLKYKNSELLECKYDTISLFEYNITKALMSSNKLYVIISEDGYSYEIYDVYSKKTALYNVDDYDFHSPFITIYQDDNIYIYNIIDGSKTPNANGDDVLLYESYYVLSTGHTNTYYNKDFKKILKEKVENED